MDIISIIMIKLHRGRFYTFLLDKSNMMEISYGLLLWRYLLGILYGGLIAISLGEYTWVWVPKNDMGYSIRYDRDTIGNITDKL